MAMQQGYSGKDHRYSGRNELYNAARPRPKRRNWAVYVLVAVIFAGMFAQVSCLAQLMNQNKQIASVTASLKSLKAEKQNLEVALNQHKNLDNIQAKAEKLGMIPVSADAVRRVPVNLAANNSDTNAQTVNNGENQ